MQNKNFLDKEGLDFATILAQTYDKDSPNESTRNLKNSTTENNLQQSPKDRGLGGTLSSSSDSHRGGYGESETLAPLGLRAISLSQQGLSQTADSQGRDGEIGRSEEREIRDSEAEQRTRRLDYIDREIQAKGRESKSEISKLLQLCNAQTKFTSLEKEEYIQNSTNYHQLQAEKKILQQRALKAYKEAGAIYNPSTKKSKHRK